MDRQVSVFWLPKTGASAQEYEDAYWLSPGQSGDDDGQFTRVIIADGASESLLARRWARHLATAFGTAPEHPATADGFTAAYQRAVAGWEVSLAQYMQERADRNSPIQWYEEPGLARGAHSTLLAAEFRWAADGDEPQWTAAALGDSCLFQVREGELQRAFPVGRSTDFSNQPALLSSSGTDLEVLRRHLTVTTGDLVPGDTYYLATDALAAWFLRMAETGQAKDEPWRPLLALDESNQGEFASLIVKQRDNGMMRDDDTTLVRIDIGI